MTHTRTQPPRAVVALAATGVLAVLAAGLIGGCSSTTSRSSSEAGRPVTADGAGAGDAAGAADKPGAAGQPPGDAALGDQARQAPTGGPADQRAIIYTGTITVRVADPDKAAAEATALAAAAGGFVGGDQRTVDDTRSTARLVLRVPSARFASVVDGIAKLGKESSRELSTEDVTTKVVDLDARIATAQASVDRVRALMARAQTIGEIVALESELSRREADLESLRAQKRRLDDLTTLSTVTALLLGPQAAIEGQPVRPETGFLAGVRSGWRAFIASMQVLLTVLGALLPWSVAIGLPLWTALWLSRRIRRRRNAARHLSGLAGPVPPVAPTPPPGG